MDAAIENLATKARRHKGFIFNKTFCFSFKGQASFPFADFKGTYFFGSRSKGDSTEDSDYDFLLTFGHKLTWKEKNQVYDLIAEIELKEAIVIDIKAYQEGELKSVWTPFRERVLKEGIFYGVDKKKHS